MCYRNRVDGAKSDEEDQDSPKARDIAIEHGALRSPLGSVSEGQGIIYFSKRGLNNRRQCNTEDEELMRGE